MSDFQLIRCLKERYAHSIISCYIYVCADETAFGIISHESLWHWMRKLTVWIFSYSVGCAWTAGYVAYFYFIFNSIAIDLGYNLWNHERSTNSIPEKFGPWSIKGGIVGYRLYYRVLESEFTSQRLSAWNTSRWFALRCSMHLTLPYSDILGSTASFLTSYFKLFHLDKQ